MGGSTTPWAVPNMNYRGFNLATMQGLADGVSEPEAAGAIGWLLYHAYLETGEKKYLDGAQQSLEFLNGLTSNPSYELQLPYGAFVAAKMNAEQGTSYNISKMLNWCFDRGALRGWGAIRGQWDGKDVSGLIGEANDGGNDYAFALNGYQQAAAQRCCFSVDEADIKKDPSDMRGIFLEVGLSSKNRSRRWCLI